jgi:hypothetical protein
MVQIHAEYDADWNVLYQVSVFMPMGNPRWPPPQDIQNVD